MKDDTLYLIHIGECMDRIDSYVGRSTFATWHEALKINDVEPWGKRIRAGFRLPAHRFQLKLAKKSSRSTAEFTKGEWDSLESKFRLQREAGSKAL